MLERSIRYFKPGCGWACKSDERSGASGARRLNGKQFAQIEWLAKLKCSVSKRNNFVLYTLPDFKPME